jgi:hypothetical protein
MEVDRLEIVVDANISSAISKLKSLEGQVASVSSRITSKSKMLSSQAIVNANDSFNKSIGGTGTLRVSGQLAEKLRVTMQGAAVAKAKFDAAPNTANLRGLKEFQTTLGNIKTQATAAGKSAAAGMNQATKSTASFMSTLSKVLIAIAMLRRAFSLIGKSIKSAMDFSETINLFQTAFRKLGLDAGKEFEMAFLERAENFNKWLSEGLMLDPKELMDYQARFAQMSNSMGLVSESAYDISESFTALGADMASLWNIDVETAMSKLQSGLAGQIRPLRQLGIDISKTSLQMVAQNYGIEQSIEKMSAAAKVQLRYLAIMQQTRIAMADFAKTIDSPANQLRILSQQWDLLSRSLGNTFLPIVSAILPYITGIVIVIRELIQEIANFFGYEIPDWTGATIYTGEVEDLAGDLGDVETGATGADKAIKKLKASVLGIDELNKLNAPDEGAGSGGGGVSVGGGAGFPALDKAIAAETAAYLAALQKQMDGMENKASEFASILQGGLKWLDQYLEKTNFIYAALKLVKDMWGFIFSPVIDEMDVFGKGISDLTEKKVKPFLAAWRDFNDTTVTLDLTNKIINEADLETIKTQIGKVVSIITTELDADKNTALANLEPLKAFMSEEDYNNVVEQTKDFYNTELKETTDGEKKINAIYAKAAKEHRTLTKAEEKEIAKIQEDMKETGIKTLSETAIESKTILRRLKDNSVAISLEQGSEIIKSAIKTRKTTIDEAEKQYTSITENAKQMLDAGKITKTEYDNIINAAEAARKSTVDAADAQFGEINNAVRTKLGDTGKYIDAETGRVLTNWDLFTQKMSNGAKNLGTGIKDGILDGIIIVKNTLVGIFNNIIKTFETAVNKVIDGANVIINKYNALPLTIDMPTLGNVYLGRLGNVPVSPMGGGGANLELRANGGFPDYGEMFIAREAGAELVGSIGGRTAVMNNDQIVESVSSGVYNAVKSALGGGMGGDWTIQVYDRNGTLTGEQIVTAAERYNRRLGVTRIAVG